MVGSTSESTLVNSDTVVAHGIGSSCHSMFKFPVAVAETTDLVVFSGSPDFSRITSQKDLFPEKEKDVFLGKECLDVSFELPTVPAENGCVFLTLNCGEVDGNTSSVVNDKFQFQKDSFFVGGDVLNTDEKIGGSALYQTVRYGDFFYKFNDLEQGDYLVDLHFAEIVFTEGPSGIRTFDVIIQDQKVVSGLDIYKQVSGNQPLVISDLNATVTMDGCLVIKFLSVNGKPLICGISIKHNDFSTGKKLKMKVDEETTSFQFGGELGKIQVNEDCGNECNCCRNIKEKYDILCKTRVELEKDLEMAKAQNEFKSWECHEAWMSLKNLQAELMTKSMHVGSLAFAVEGQVKEKSKWFSSLREISMNIKLLKTDHSKLKKEASDHKSELADMVSQILSVQLLFKDQAVLQRENEVLKRNFLKESISRKELYNKVLELKGNIRVFCRSRPLNMGELSRGVSVVVDFESAKDGELTVRPNCAAPRKLFKFDSVFGPESDQDSVFEASAPLVTSVLDGYNVCIFAYGQTGTGKTFTMEGTEDARGVNYKTLEELFRIIKEREGVYQYEISVSALEVYNEQIRDLLASETHHGKRLEIRQAADGVHSIPGLVEANVSNMRQVWDVLQTGSNARVVGSTSANEHSSRSHCLHCVMVKGRNMDNGECIRSKLWLIDLAGSERIAKTDVQGERLKEAQNINKSLSALGDVISALATKSPHIPFRNSKLTHLLQDSLGGDSKALMFVQISISEDDVNETLCSLNFASRVRGIELGLAKKQFDGGEIQKYKQMLEKAKQDSKGKVKKMEDTIHSIDTKLKAKEASNKNLQDKVKELESRLIMERSFSRQKDTNNGRLPLEPRENFPLMKENNKPDVNEEATVMSKKEVSGVSKLVDKTFPPIPKRINRLSFGPQKMDTNTGSLMSRRINRLSICSEKLPVILPNTDVSEEATVMSKKEVSKLVDKTFPPIPKRINRLSFGLQKMDSNTGSLMSRRINRLSICPEKLPVIPPNTGRKCSVGPRDDASTSSSPSGVIKKQPQRNILRKSLQKKLVVLRPQHLQPVSGKGCGGGNMATKSIVMKPRRLVPSVNRIEDKKETKKRQIVGGFHF
ncbi:Kinesin-4 [Zostera marina]|uniref:Kinesin-4 n=1 Tax=Zostera marina TaxID=29655 RepID=A0A0K9PV80_ZOSMR|nr:Kinesin-4 [Zostera marina]